MNHRVEIGPATALEAVLAAASALLDPEKLATLVVDHIKQLLEVDGAALYWWDSHEEVLTALADNDPRMSVPIPVVNPGQGLVGIAFEENRSVTTADDGKPDEGPSWMRELKIRDGAAVPILVEGRPRGVLIARTYTDRAFSTDDLEIMRVTGEQIAPTLANMGLLARAQRERNVAHALAELMRAATACEDVDALLRLIVRYATRLLGADYGRVETHEAERQGAADGEVVLRETDDGGEVLCVPIETPKKAFGRLVLRFRTDVTITRPQQIIASTLAGFAASALDRAHVDAAVLRHEALMQTVLKTAPVAFLAVDRNCVVTFREGLDLVRLGLDGTGVGDQLPQREGPLDALRAIALRAIEGEEVVEAIASDSVALELRFSPIRDATGAVTGATGVAIDLSERRGLEEKLAFRATHDALTELPNRELFLDRLAQALIASHRTRDPLAVVVLDVEEFAEVNATVGPRGADVALRELAMRLARRTDVPGATLARVDGDRFGWILPGADDAASLSFIRRVTTVADDPFHIDGHVVGLRVTLGIAQHGGALIEAAEITRHAIIAMQRARDEHAAFAVYDPAMDRDPDALAVVTELRDAVTRDALALRYQPIVSLGVRRTVAAEALVRWVHPGRGLLGPDAFVPVAERVGLIGRVTSWVLDRALRDLARWRGNGLHCGVTVNLSAWDVADPTVPERFATLLRLHRADPSDVTFEITESAVMSDRPQTLEVLHRLTEIGASIALDDFGTGYSSFAYLQRLPISCIKIDRSFVAALQTRVDSRVIVGALIHLGHDLGLKVVAEGVEEQEQLGILEMLGCPSAQGHLFARAMSVADLTARLRAESPFEGMSTA
ncbi:MAG TPA: EAL domain-containing protein [Candidatus Elarobacter sp.]|jgi:diguanylate cyclase (GGDEF)-like protein